jgi:hypothetical protein
MTDDKKGWGQTVLGWFVVRGDASGGDVDIDPGPPAPSVEPVGELPAAPGGVVDFDAVFAAFGLDPDSRDRLAKAQGLLESLPVGTEAGVKRQIVEASLKAFGVPFEKIIETACEEVQALDSYQRKGASTLQEFCDEAGKRIVGLEEQIRSIRAAMEKQVADQKLSLEACNRKKLEVQRVLEFFGPETVARVVRDSPKLIEPGAAGATGSR